MSNVRPPPRRTSGIVLVVVLLGLALMMILLLALFAGTLQQSHGAAGDALLGREEMLADSAVALVIGQIGQASTQAGQAWISQPGLLRTYAAADASRKPTSCYKLYSTASLANMIDQTGTLAFMAADVPSDWSSRPADYTDLNSPVQAIYPILAQTAVGTVPGIGTDTGQVAMPVAWLYQLQDGTLGPASNGTAANPIVARIAFWTDDETSKININTAGCGSSWNTPRTNSLDDVTGSTMQPAAGEFSAYPGHPATISLGGVFPALMPQQLLGLTPRYAWGGSQFGSQTTMPGESVPLKTDRLYASVDELCFSSSLTSGGQRQPNPVGANSTAASQFQNELKTARFVLTAHSEAPETTLLGEPRVAIWPVAEAPVSDTTRLTATDRAIMTAATVGAGTANVRTYYFQRNDPLNALDDFDPKNTATSPATASNLRLFNDLVARGTVLQPGYSAAFDSTNPAAKYPDANWNQIMLEITDFIRGLNSVDPNPAITPFAKSDPTTGIGRGFIVPLTMQYGPVANQMTLRGLGRCPTLSSLTLVFYVCGFQFSDGTVVDFDNPPDDVKGDTWNSYFGPGKTWWTKLKYELVRAFVIPCTFMPACGYPEVSDACKIQIAELSNLQVSSGSSPLAGFGFQDPATSALLGTPFQKLPSERAWGGNEGPLAWLGTADELMNGQSVNYPFAPPPGSTAFKVPMTTTAPTLLNPQTAGLAWPPTYRLNFVGADLTVSVIDSKGHVLQTLAVHVPSFTTTAPFSAGAPTINCEGNQADSPLIGPSQSDWTGNKNCAVQPSWYMSLVHRLEAWPTSRAMMIQAGDITRSVEVCGDPSTQRGYGGDLRVTGALSSVPSSMFQPHPGYYLLANHQGGSQAHNFRFADGTSASFAPGILDSDNLTPTNASYGLNKAVAQAKYPTPTKPLLSVADWRGSPPTFPPAYYSTFTNPPCSVPTGTNEVYMTGTMSGDWDTGPGFAPDGALIDLPDSGTTLDPADAYQSLTTGLPGAATLRTPNALVPSPVIFGSLPAGINPNDSLLAATNPNGQPQSQQWRTLLFCPYPAASTPITDPLGIPYASGPLLHPGAASPPDHLILDNFWMPVVEPYAISTCMATAGKINLNDQIAPFTYLHRNTALRALLDSLRIPAVSVSDAGSPATVVSYKSKATGAAIPSIWNAVDDDATVAQIENRFSGGSTDAYLSESEICTVPLVPLVNPPSPFSTNVAATRAALVSYWDATAAASSGGLTGDNLRELPYAQLYGRLTTRSNSYTVHVHVQVLKKLTRDPNQNEWNEGTDVVLGDWRGSYEIERDLDPTIAAPVAGKSLAGTVSAPGYKFRIINARAFEP